MKAQEKELTDDLTALNKKAKFLEKQFLDANAQMRDIVSTLTSYIPLVGFVLTES